MIGLVITLTIAFVIAYLSLNNNPGINIAIGDYQFFNIPLYMITVGTYLLGIILAWIIEVPAQIATGFQIMGLGRTIKSGNNSIVQLQNKILKLEAENAKLHERNLALTSNPHTVNNDQPNIIQKLLRKIKTR